MGEITLKNKKNIGAGNFEYTYQCFCDPKPLKDIVVTSGNDKEAEQLAQMACDEYCDPLSLGKKSSREAC
jgi:hypothetical protein